MASLFDVLTRKNSPTRRVAGAVRRAWHSLTYKRRFLAAFAANGLRAETVLFYPDRPREWGYMHYKVCHQLGLRMTNDPKADMVLTFRFEDETWKHNDARLAEWMRSGRRVINGRCTDVSKRAVDTAFARVFGYSISVDPGTHAGPYVRKSDLNATHDGVVLEAPAEPEEGFVYQKLIDNRSGEDRFADLRVIVCADTIPFVYHYYRFLSARFTNNISAVELKETGEVLSDGEVAGLLRLCREMGVDLGALDVLRDRVDGRIYVVDVNDTAKGPPITLGGEYHDEALRRLAAVFKAGFLET
ncbi:MAG TPA: hypothetical protein VI759_10910, partial [Dehalococcoidia bacterium]|nr:hypothetical protein [Dehalococcoidia bacterium]